MAAAAQTQCPVVGTTNDVLPPHHPSVDLTKDGQKCPVVGATTDHHHNMHQHPPVAIDDSVPATADLAARCPVLQNKVSEPQSMAMDDEVCPVIGPATTVLPPDHPSTENAKEGDICPVTKATIKHHKKKVHEHPDVSKAEHGSVCPVAGVKV